MTSKPVAFLLADLGVIQSHSRPHVSVRAPRQRPSRLVPTKKREGGVPPSFRTADPYRMFTGKDWIT
jgi:putative transposase